MAIHATWNSTNLLIWSGTRAPSPESIEALRVQLSALCSDPLVVTAADVQQLKLAAPAGELLIEALSFAPADGIDLLQALGQPLSESLGDSVRFWVTVAQLTVERIRSQSFYPSVTRVQQHYRASWKALLSSRAEIDQLERLAAAMPACASLNPQDGLAAVESFIARSLDALVRRAASVDPFFTRVHKLASEAGVGVDVRWLSALLDQDQRIAGEDDEVARFHQQLTDWTAPLMLAATEQEWTLGFELAEPTDADEMSWPLRFRLDPHDSATEPIPAADVWIGGEVDGVVGRSITERRELLRDELRRAAELCPPLNRIVDSATPSEIVLTPEEAHLFLRRWSEQLIVSGFDVTLPSWADLRETRVGLLLSLNPAQENPDDWIDPPGRSNPGSGGTFTQGRMGLDTLLNFDWRIAVGDEELTAEEFQRMLETQSPLVKMRGKWIEIDRTAAEAAAKLLLEKKQGQMTLGDAFRVAYGAGAVDGAVPVVGLRGTSWVQQLLEQLPSMSAEKIEQPISFVGDLRSYQLRGLQWLWFLDHLGIGACLADDMGLGKTIQLIALFLQERLDGAIVGPTLLFAPTSVIGNWTRELARFAPKLKVILHHGPQRLRGLALADASAAHDIVVTSYALAHRDLEDLRKIKWHRIALDEAQKVKNPSAASTTAIKSIEAQRRIAMTGTPIENHLAELWSIMDALNPGLLGSAREFRERFAVPIEKLEDRVRAEHLKRMIRPFVLRRTKNDPEIAGDLPEKMEMNVYCSLTAEQAAMYERITAEMLARIDSADGIRRRGLILAALTRLKQVCDHPLLLTKTGEIDGRSGKCERLVDMLEEVIEEGEAALVFTQYREMGHILERLLRTRLGTEPLFLHGGVSRKSREDMVENFQAPKSATKVFILSLRAGGLGLNLTAANHVFHFDRWWNPAVEAQATDRAHRIGQNKTVQVHKFIAMGTLEERIDQMLSQKMQLADNIVGTGDEWLTNLSTSELREYLKLSSEAVQEFEA